MKLFLHWISTDLRRFRWLLLTWTLALAAFVSWLGWQCANILWVDPTWPKWNEPMTAVLGILEAIILFSLYGSDPAVGSDTDWKTRPPSGFAISGSKVVISLLWFILLPLLAYGVMLKICALEDADAGSWGSLRWQGFIWWVQALIVGCIALSATAARGSKTAVGHTMVGFGLFVLSVIILLKWLPSAHELENAWMPAVWLVVGIGCYMITRRSRTPSRWFVLIPVTTPMVLLLLYVVTSSLRTNPPSLLRYPGTQSAHVKPLDAAIAEKLHIGPVLMRGGIWRSDGTQHVPMTSLVMRLHLAGLPPDCIATGHWTELHLQGPTGEVLHASPEQGRQVYHGPIGQSFDAKSLWLVSGNFRSSEIAPFSQQLVQGSGKVHITVQQRTTKHVPLSEHTTDEGNYGSFRLSKLATEQTQFPTLKPAGLLWMTYSGRYQFTQPWFWIEEVGTGLAYNVQAISSRSSLGYFIPRDLSRGPLHVADGRVSVLFDRCKKDLDRGAHDRWQLGFSYYEPIGELDLPVQLEPFGLCKLHDGQPDAEEMVAKLSMAPNASATEVKQTLKHAFSLCSGFIQKPEFMKQELKRLLEEVPPAHASVLGEIALEEPSPHWNMWGMFDPLLWQRWVKFMTPAEVEQVRKVPNLFRGMRYYLAEQGLIPMKEKHGESWAEMSDEKLASAWQDSVVDPAPILEPLAEAAKRGLPWAMPALAELAELRPHGAEMDSICKWMPTISDCPADLEPCIAWLKAHATSLQWDTTKRRWTLP